MFWRKIKLCLDIYIRRYRLFLHFTFFFCFLLQCLMIIYNLEDSYLKTSRLWVFDCRHLFLLTLMNRKLALLRMVALMRIELLMSKPFDVEAVGVFWWGVRMLFMCITTDMECRKKPHILSVYEQWSRTCPWVTLILYSDLMWFWPCIVVNMWK